MTILTAAQMPILTAAQKRALEWLTSDGAWRSGPDRQMASSLTSLRWYLPNWVEHGQGPKLVPRGKPVNRWRLTPLGQQSKATLEDYNNGF